MQEEGKSAAPLAPSEGHCWRVFLHAKPNSCFGREATVNRFARALSHKQAKRISRTSSQLLIAEDKTGALVDDYGFALCNKFGY